MSLNGNGLGKNYLANIVGNLIFIVLGMMMIPLGTLMIFLGFPNFWQDTVLSMHLFPPKVVSYALYFN